MPNSCDCYISLHRPHFAWKISFWYKSSLQLQHKELLRTQFCFIWTELETPPQRARRDFPHFHRTFHIVRKLQDPDSILLSVSSWAGSRFAAFSSSFLEMSYGVEPIVTVHSGNIFLFTSLEQCAVPIPTFTLSLSLSLSLRQIIMGKGRDSIQWNDDISLSLSLSLLVGQMGTLFWWSTTNKRETTFIDLWWYW